MILNRYKASGTNVTEHLYRVVTCPGTNVDGSPSVPPVFVTVTFSFFFFLFIFLFSFSSQIAKLYYHSKILQIWQPTAVRHGGHHGQRR
jgi:hypothetical protein